MLGLEPDRPSVSAQAARPLDFILGGVQKCGTTALSRYLADLPGVHMEDVELHFFDDETGVDWADPDYAAYERRVGGAEGDVRGDDTPIYLYWPNSLERIRAYRPDIKLIFLFRDPVDRAWSHWRMEYARGLEAEPFAWCIREGRARLARSSTPGFHRVQSYVERGFYGAQLARVLRLFARDQVLCLLSSDLLGDPTSTLGRICRFIGAPEPAGPVTPRVERPGIEMDYGASMTAADVEWLRGLYRDDIQTFAALSGLDVTPWLQPPPKAMS
jgi:hypothetical protein